MAEKDEKSAVKNKIRKKAGSSVQEICSIHDLSETEVKKIQKDLLNWYDANQRVLPWRSIAKTETDSDLRGYAVWVSEIMLQQTQVATVISYFNKWMKKWPTVSDLASASLEDVNKVWAGLGYYSRARRLHEGAKIVMEKLNGAIPQTVDELMKQIPGIGLYSASAIASVAFQKPVGVVDGNVIRVLSRMRLIGAPITESGVKDHLWKLANKVVSVKRPGDFNQAIMELGAIICTPQNPNCSVCPVQSCCNAYKMVKKYSSANGLDSYLKKNTNSKRCISETNDIPDIENADACSFCLDPSKWKENPQVTAYPCKIDKKSSRLENIGVVVIQKGDSFLMTKRPDKGLLAGLWEFPSTVHCESDETKKISSVVESMLSEFNIPLKTMKKRVHVGEVIHIFSHIKTTYVVNYLKVDDSLKIENKLKELIWSTEEEIHASAVSTAMKKVFAAVKKTEKNPTMVSSKKRKKSADGDSKQKSIKAFFS